MPKKIYLGSLIEIFSSVLQLKEDLKHFYNLTELYIAILHLESVRCFSSLQVLYLFDTPFANISIHLQKSHFVPSPRCAQACDEKDLELLTDIKSQIKEKENVFFDMEAYLPKKNGSVLHQFVINFKFGMVSV